MPVIKLNLSFDSSTVDVMRQRAAEEKKPTSRYLADLIAADVRRRQDELAAEGYRFLSEDGLRFAEAVLPLALEVWPEWNEIETTNVITNTEVLNPHHDE